MAALDASVQCGEVRDGGLQAEPHRPQPGSGCLSAALLQPWQERLRQGTQVAGHCMSGCGLGLVIAAFIKRHLARGFGWWWLFPRQQDFFFFFFWGGGGPVRPFIPRLCFFFFSFFFLFLKSRLARTHLFHFSGQDQSTVAQQAETTVAECFLMS